MPRLTVASGLVGFALAVTSGCGLLIGLDEFTNEACEAGSVVECPYSGAPGTKDVGACHAAVRVCKPDRSGYEPCTGEVTPQPETCADPADEDCDGEANEGCTCLVGETEPCYSGPPETEGVGLCIGGTRACLADGSGWGPCEGEVSPAPEACASQDDEDCDGHDCVQWGLLFGDDTAQYVSDAAVDSMGNTYVVGRFFGAIQLEGNTLVAAGGSDLFLAKFDASGHHVWSLQIGDNGSEEGQSVAVDGEGNVVVGGFDFDFIMSSPALFVRKYDSFGGQLWGKTLWGSFCGFGDRSSIESIATDAQGDIVLAGYFCGNIDFGDGAISAPADSPDGFVAKLRGSDGSGKTSDGAWTRVFGDGQSQYARAVAVDPAGSIIVAGDFYGTVNLGLGTLTSAGDRDVFLAKYTAQGGASWSRRVGAVGDQMVNGLALDGIGGPIITGSFEGAVDFGAGAVPADGYDGFALGYSSGNIYQWSVTFGGPGEQTGRALAVDASGQVFLAGTFEGSVDLGAGMLTSSGGSDMFLAKLTSSGVGIWSKQFGDTDTQIASAIGLVAGESPVLVGHVRGTVDLGAGALTAAGDFDGFVARFGL